VTYIWRLSPFHPIVIGLAALRQINPEVQKAVSRAGLPLSMIQSRTKPWFSTGNPFETLLELSIPDLIRNAGGATTHELLVDDEVLWCTIMRGTLQVCPSAIPFLIRLCFSKALSLHFATFPIRKHFLRLSQCVREVELGLV
jgi:hypothetical protein